MKKLNAGWINLGSILKDLKDNNPVDIGQINSAFCDAAELGDVDTLQALLNRNANVNVEIDYRTPLYRAANNGYLDVVKFLLGANADKEAAAGGKTAYQIAVYRKKLATSTRAAQNYQAIMNALIEEGANATP